MIPLPARPSPAPARDPAKARRDATGGFVQKLDEELERMEPALDAKVREVSLQTERTMEETARQRNATAGLRSAPLHRLADELREKVARLHGAAGPR